MAHDFEPLGPHDPALTRQHAAGPAQDRLTPAERALAPESHAPLQSANAIADDGTYLGRGGGYKGGDANAIHGEGTYGYPAGTGVGVPGGEHQPEGLPDPSAPGPEDLLPPEPTVVANRRLANRDRGQTVG
jgi:hypothetical protein